MKFLQIQRQCQPIGYLTYYLKDFIRTKKLKPIQIFFEAKYFFRGENFKKMLSAILNFISFLFKSAYDFWQSETSLSFSWINFTFSSTSWSISRPLFLRYSLWSNKMESYTFFHINLVRSHLDTCLTIMGYSQKTTEGLAY